MEPDDTAWTFIRPEDVLQFAAEQDDIGHLDSYIIMNLFNRSKLDYGIAYTTEDRALVDFYDALVATWQGLVDQS